MSDAYEYWKKRGVKVGITDSAIPTIDSVNGADVPALAQLVLLAESQRQNVRMFKVSMIATAVSATGVCVALFAVINNVN